VHNPNRDHFAALQQVARCATSTGTVASSDAKQITKLKALVIAQRANHQLHHLMMAKGDPSLR
jgi:hypothetical protein